MCCQTLSSLLALNSSSTLLLKHHPDPPLECLETLLCTLALLLLLSIDPDPSSNDAAADREDGVNASVVALAWEITLLDESGNVPGYDELCGHCW
jgi:hypothetical protein